jgi:NAD(P)-dependent dehydrogenase (short-subunit alcohol dehydrogenase family)
MEFLYSALFLASKESSFISGIDLPVDGGLVSV